MLKSVGRRSSSSTWRCWDEQTRQGGAAGRVASRRERGMGVHIWVSRSVLWVLLAGAWALAGARNNVLLAVPAFLYAINNYLKFTMQLYFNPATVKMLSNLKVLVIAVLLKMIMKRRFSIIQWEALALLLIGISVNQLRSLPAGSSALDLTISTGAYIYTLIFVTVPSLASVYNEYALKSQYDTSIYLQNLFLYGYGAIFNFLGIVVMTIVKAEVIVLGITFNPFNPPRPESTKLQSLTFAYLKSLPSRLSHHLQTIPLGYRSISGGLIFRL
ncbi:hypothetical protein ACLB2K_066298 [Fragaria x ananassa]